jgi:hypothetical protein
VTVLATWAWLVLLATFVEALWAHLGEPARLRASLTEIGVPPSLVGPTSLVVMFADAVIAATLLLQPGAGAAAAAAYLVIVTAPILLAYGRGRTLSDCGCSRQRRAVDVSLFLRNACLGVASIVVALDAPAAALSVTMAIALIGLIGSLGLPAAVRWLAGIDAARLARSG